MKYDWVTDDIQSLSDAVDKRLREEKSVVDAHDKRILAYDNDPQRIVEQRIRQLFMSGMTHSQVLREMNHVTS